jgi:hypothetical protein
MMQTLFCYGLHSFSIRKAAVMSGMIHLTCRLYLPNWPYIVQWQHRIPTTVAGTCRCNEPPLSAYVQDALPSNLLMMLCSHVASRILDQMCNHMYHVNATCPPAHLTDTWWYHLGLQCHCNRWIIHAHISRKPACKAVYSNYTHGRHTRMFQRRSPPKHYISFWQTHDHCK